MVLQSEIGAVNGVDIDAEFAMGKATPGAEDEFPGFPSPKSEK